MEAAEKSGSSDEHHPSGGISVVLVDGSRDTSSGVKISVQENCIGLEYNTEVESNAEPPQSLDSSENRGLPVDTSGDSLLANDFENISSQLNPDTYSIEKIAAESAALNDSKDTHSQDKHDLSNDESRVSESNSVPKVSISLVSSEDSVKSTSEQLLRLPRPLTDQHSNPSIDVPVTFKKTDTSDTTCESCTLENDEQIYDSEVSRTDFVAHEFQNNLENSSDSVHCQSSHDINRSVVTDIESADNIIPVDSENVDQLIGAGNKQPNHNEAAALIEVTDTSDKTLSKFKGSSFRRQLSQASSDSECASKTSNESEDPKKSQPSSSVNLANVSLQNLGDGSSAEVTDCVVPSYMQVLRTPTDLSSCSQESDDSDALLSELESELEGADGSEGSRSVWCMNNGSQINYKFTRNKALPESVQIKQLEQTNYQLQCQLAGLKEKFSLQEADHNKVLAETKAELVSKVEKLTKQLETANKEKELMVMRYAQSEKEVIVARKSKEEAERKHKEVAKERDQYFSRVRSLNNERARLCNSLDKKMADVANLQKDHERQKEELSSRDIKIKWAQNKLKTEVEAHKETLTKLEQTQARLKEMREEAEQVRKDCQEMIKRYQESEEIKSVSLDHELRRKLNELEEQKAEKENQEEVYQLLRQELDSLKRKHKLGIDENNTLTMKIQNLERERLEYEQTVSKLKEKHNSLKQEIVDLTGRLSEMENLRLQLEREKDKVTSANQEVERIRQSNAELQADMEACHRKEGELLEFTEKLTAKSVHLQSEHSLLELKAQNLEEECTSLTRQVNELTSQCESVKSSLDAEKQHRQHETQLLAKKLAERTKAVELLTIKVEEVENEQKVTRRRHISSVKELSRELQQLRKKMEMYESSSNSNHVTNDSTSIGSRTSSTASLETLASNSQPLNPGPPPPVVTFVNTNKQYSKDNATVNSNSSSPNLPPVQVQVDKQMLIERIVKLQKNLARKNEKVEFLEEHINQLLSEIKKKSRIIQNYITREEAGALVSSKMDQNKVELSKKGGIMASVYNCQPADSNMTLELSLEINQKLQAVLEDTLLKNITLKENINTLGEEIARLTKQEKELYAHRAKLVK